MTIDTGLFYLIIVVSVVHSVLVIVLDMLYLRSLRRLDALKKEMAAKTSGQEREAEKIIEEARHKSRSLLAEAANSSSRIMNEAKLFTGATENVFKQSLEKAAGAYEAQFRDVLARADAETGAVLKNLAADIRKPLTLQLEAFTTSFQKELASLREETRGQIANLQKQTLDEVSQYKAQKLKEAEKVIFELSRDIVRQIVGREIGPEKHEELVLKALEEAKRQKVF